MMISNTRSHIHIAHAGGAAIVSIGQPPKLAQRTEASKVWRDERMKGAVLNACCRPCHSFQNRSLLI